MKLGLQVKSWRLWQPARRHPWFFWGVAGLIALILGALLVAYSGIVNIAASAGHPLWLERFLALGMRRSIEAHSDALVVPQLPPDFLPLGAAHFHGNCAICHGAPGQPVNPTFGQMLPSPPPLQKEAQHWRTRELYWIGYHGLQFTGMPSWSGAGREDEMWVVAALLRELPTMDATTYRRLASGNTRLAQPPAEEIVRTGANIFPINTCDRCHGTDNAPAASFHIPRLGGQSQAYLLRALQEYRSDRRQSGFMEPVAATLSDEQMEDLARYYADLAESAREPERADSAAEIRLGRQLAERGDPDNLVPPCLACHGATGRGEFPRLAGQHAPYIEQQLRVWQAGGRVQTAYGIIMAQVAHRLSQEQIAAVAAYFASVSSEGGLVAPVGVVP